MLIGTTETSDRGFHGLGFLYRRKLLRGIRRGLLWDIFSDNRCGRIDPADAAVDLFRRRSLVRAMSNAYGNMPTACRHAALTASDRGQSSLIRSPRPSRTCPLSLE